MKENICTNTEQLPLYMKPAHIAMALGISLNGAYEIIHNKTFPSVKVGRRWLVQKDKFLHWVEQQSGT